MRPARSAGRAGDPAGAPRHCGGSGPCGSCRQESVVRRRCACGGGGGSCTCDEEPGALSRRATGPAPAQAPQIVADVLGSAARPLDARTRAFFGPRFGADLSGVRLHDDARAADSAAAVNARAYAVGPDVVLGRGAPPLDSDAGRQLLAHELAHVVQADGAPSVRRAPTAHGIRELGDPDWTSCERPAGAVGGVGRARPTSALRFLTEDVLGLRFWELDDFDVDRSFVKPGHEAFLRREAVHALRDLIVRHDADVLVVGEASTTHRRNRNLALSRHRAAVRAVAARGRAAPRGGGRHEPRPGAGGPRRHVLPLARARSGGGGRGGPQGHDRRGQARSLHR